MITRQGVLVVLFMSLVCVIFLYFSQRHLTGPWLRLALNPEYADLLVESMENSRELARRDPEREAHYKDQFTRTQTLLAHMEILRANRKTLTTRYLMILFGLILLSIITVSLLTLWNRKVLKKRLARLQSQLEYLAAGGRVPPPAERRRDLIGRISHMIHSTGMEMARAQQRVKSLEHLEAWQESLRRMAHEIRTPLTAIRLEMKKLVKAALLQTPKAAEELSGYEASILEEMNHLNSFTDQYTSFAKVGKPKLKQECFQSFLQEFVELYREAWANLHLRLTPEVPSWPVLMDRRLIRQVLVNLCNNSSKALADERGTVSFELAREGEQIILAVRDDGPGIDPNVIDRIFEPYTTTKEVGEGMGLGLSICKKIMLDHRGDLELEENSREGACFRLIFSVDVDKLLEAME